jgi:hypothetical protein
MDTTLLMTIHSGGSVPVSLFCWKLLKGRAVTSWAVSVWCTPTPAAARQRVVIIPH